MILPDTSVWSEFFRGASRAASLAQRIGDGAVLVHPWVVGELVLGALGRARGRVLADLRLLPAAAVVGDHDLLGMIEARRLGGVGIGWVDAQLLASALVEEAELWSFDAPLAAAARAAGVGHGRSLA